MARKEWKVLLIEDDPMVQEVNKDFITTVKGVTVCATAGNGEEGMKLIKEEQPDPRHSRCVHAEKRRHQDLAGDQKAKA